MWIQVFSPLQGICPIHSLSSELFHKNSEFVYHFSYFVLSYTTYEWGKFLGVWYWLLMERFDIAGNNGAPYDFWCTLVCKSILKLYQVSNSIKTLVNTHQLYSTHLSTGTTGNTLSIKNIYLKKMNKVKGQCHYRTTHCCLLYIRYLECICNLYKEINIILRNNETLSFANIQYSIEPENFARLWFLVLEKVEWFYQKEKGE